MFKTVFKVFLLVVFTGIALFPFAVCAEDGIEINQYEEIDNFVTEQMEQYHMPSLALGIIDCKSSDTSIYLKGFGKTDSSGQNVTPQTPFIIGSVSKSFTGIAVMQLVERGQINLDDSIEIYIPWFRAEYNGRVQTITVRQLLQHTSGIKAFYEGMADSGKTIEQLTREELNNQELNCLPGTNSNYSNANYIILGEIIQCVSGQSYKDYISENIFKPLEMNHSFTSKEDAQMAGLATGHQKWFGYPMKAELPYYEYGLPEGQIISCAEDMVNYMSALLNKGVYKNISILSEEGVEELFNTQVQEEYVPAGLSGTSSYYGFGWRIIFDSGRRTMIQHTGETGNYHANVVLKLDEGIGVVELDSLGGDMSPVSIGVGIADIMTGKQPKTSRFINNVFLAETILVIIIFLFLMISIFRLKKWKMKIAKSIGHLIYIFTSTVIINFAIPAMLLILFGCLVGNFQSNLLVFPDITWTALLISAILIAIGISKIILIILYFKDKKKKDFSFV